MAKNETARLYEIFLQKQVVLRKIVVTRNRTFIVYKARQEKLENLSINFFQYSGKTF